MSSKSQKHCLIIEDNVICQKIYQVMFKKIKCQTTLVSTAGEAMDLLNEIHYDCIITDWGLPDCEGDFILRAIRSSFQNDTTPILVISAHVCPELIQTSQSFAVQGVYSKPLNPNIMVELLSAYLHLS